VGSPLGSTKRLLSSGTLWKELSEGEMASHQGGGKGASYNFDQKRTIIKMEAFG